MRRITTEASRGAGIARLATLALFALCVLAARDAGAELKIDITRGKAEPLPIAITAFQGEDQATARVGREISDVVAADLERSGLFRTIDERAFIQDAQSLAVRPRFPDWRAINAQALVQGRAVQEPDGRMRIEFRLWDVFAESQMTGLAYFTQPANARRVAHIVADAIYQRITGEQGYFDSRIVYVSETGPAQKRIKRLAIMDQDGANHRYLTDGSSLVLTPRFSPTRQEITYLAYEGGEPRVHLLNIDTGQREVLGRFPGMTFSPRFSPDGETVVMSMSRSGNADVHAMDLRTGRVNRLTQNPAIDTSPSFSPDGSRIVFNSDRGGSQQLYVMDAGGGNVQRISFGQGRYSTPVWSPRGDLVAFTKLHGGTFAIGVMRPDGSGERQLTQSYHEEGPTWAPNGRVLMFFRQERFDSQGRGGRSRLFTIDITGDNLREVPTPHDASDPAWSPLQR